MSGVLDIASQQPKFQSVESRNCRLLPPAELESESVKRCLCPGVAPQLLAECQGAPDSLSPALLLPWVENPKLWIRLIPEHSPEAVEAAAQHTRQLEAQADDQRWEGQVGT
jgi:hypothetical protein